MKKRLIESMFVILFTGALCIFSVNVQPLSEEITDTSENAASIRFSSAEYETLKSCEETKAAPSEEAALVKIQTENGQTEETLLEDVQLDKDSLMKEVQLDKDSLMEEIQLDKDSLMEEVQLDKDTLLSIVSGLSGDEELICSNLNILTSPQTKKTQNIIQRFHKNGSQVSFIVLDLNTGNYLSLNPDFLFYSASTIKGPYVAALNKFSPEMIDEYTEFMMENTIQWSSNEDYENLHYLYGNDVMYDMTEYTDVSDSIIDEYDWYPYLTAKDLTQLWIGAYVYFFEDTNENSEWCRSLYTDSTESFIHSALSEDYTVYTKPGWYSDWEDVSRNDAGIVMADGHDYILTIMSDAFDSYDDLEELAAALDEAHELLCSSDIAG